jgi:hypothetical protein
VPRWRGDATSGTYFMLTTEPSWAALSDGLILHRGIKSGERTDKFVQRVRESLSWLDQNRVRAGLAPLADDRVVIFGRGPAPDTRQIDFERVAELDAADTARKATAAAEDLAREWELCMARLGRYRAAARRLNSRGQPQLRDQRRRLFWRRSDCQRRRWGAFFDGDVARGVLGGYEYFRTRRKGEDYGAF